jgi:sec-independent protein translocase protein TatB
MFDSIGWEELLVIALAALFLFGPDRLPTAGRDAARVLRRARTVIRDLRDQLDESLPDELVELRSVDLNRYRPKTLIREHLLGDDPTPLGVPATGAVSRGRSPGEPG